MSAAKMVKREAMATPLVGVLEGKDLARLSKSYADTYRPRARIYYWEGGPDPRLIAVRSTVPSTTPKVGIWEGASAWRLTVKPAGHFRYYSLAGATLAHNYIQ